MYTISVELVASVVRVRLYVELVTLVFCSTVANFDCTWKIFNSAFPKTMALFVLLTLIIKNGLGESSSKFFDCP